MALLKLLSRLFNGEPILNGKQKLRKDYPNNGIDFGYHKIALDSNGNHIRELIREPYSIIETVVEK